MHYTKRPLTLDEQVDLLVSRGLLISDRARAKRWLERTSYYRLSAYFLPIKIRDTDRYYSGATFEAVLDLYKFDARLRVLVLQGIERIEVAARASMVYEIAHTLGPFAYANPANFSPGFDHAKLMDEITTERSRSREAFVEHFGRKYYLEPHLPIWMVSELLSLGAVSMMYKGFPRHLQRKISDHFQIAEGPFKSWLHTLNYIRNVCAHHNRLWNRQLAIAPAIPHEFPYSVPSNNRVYAVVMLMQHVLEIIAPRCRWKDRVMCLILEHSNVPLMQMGFPANWKNVEPWKTSKL